MPQLNANAPYARKLKSLLDNDDYGFKVEELAEVAGCSKRHLYNVLDPGKDTNLGADKKDKISRYLSEHGITDLAYTGLDGPYRIVRARNGEADGDATDDVMDVVKAATGLDDAYDQLNPDEALRYLDDIRHEIADLEAEIARLKGRQ
jgi:AraC-like DNA-binding protein